MHPRVNKEGAGFQNILHFHGKAPNQIQNTTGEGGLVVERNLLCIGVISHPYRCRFHFQSL